MSLFVGDTLKPIILETEFEDLASAEVTRILYQKPGGTEGYWQASVSGNSLIYLPEEGDIDIVGKWTFQAYIEVGGKVSRGNKVPYEVQKPIPVT